MQLSARRLTDRDQGLCRGFACGRELYELEVATWIRADLWRVLPEYHGKEIVTTVLQDLDQNGRLVGFCSWSFIDAEGATELDSPVQISLAYFGVHDDYQGKPDGDGILCADRLLKTVLADASRSDPDSGRLPVVLLCSEANRNGLRFWERHGFEIIEPEIAGTPIEGHHRMVLGGAAETPGDET